MKYCTSEDVYIQRNARRDFFLEFQEVKKQCPTNSQMGIQWCKGNSKSNQKRWSILARNARHSN